EGVSPLTSHWDVILQKGEHMYMEGLSLLPVSSRAPVSLAPHQTLNPAEEQKVLSLVSKHGPDKLYQVTSNISGSKDLDLTLQRGQIVALLQSVDTKGNTSRWLVDAGGPRGFVPAGKLQPY
ncbi:Rho guanine nucleotide exchange factor 37, partial [Eudyptes moseleyi]